MASKSRSKSKTRRAEPRVAEGNANVYADLGYANATEMQRKSRLAAEIARAIDDRHLRQQDAAELLGIDQSKVTRIIRGQFRGVSEAMLLELLAKLGHDVKIELLSVRRKGNVPKTNRHRGTRFDDFLREEKLYDEAHARKPLSVSHRKRLVAELREDGALAAEFLNAAAEEVDPRVYLAALRTVVEAQGMAKIAKAAGMPRESLHRALSEGGNPRFSTVLAVLRAAGFKLSVQRV